MKPVRGRVYRAHNGTVSLYTSEEHSYQIDDVVWLSFQKPKSASDVAELAARLEDAVDAIETKRENERLKKRNVILERDCDELQARSAKQAADSSELKRENERLKARVLILETQLKAHALADDDSEDDNDYINISTVEHGSVTVSIQETQMGASMDEVAAACNAAARGLGFHPPSVDEHITHS